MDIKAMAKEECYKALMRLVDKQELTGQRKLAKALGIKEAKAKEILNGDLENWSQGDIIKLTSKLITLRLNNGTAKEE